MLQCGTLPLAHMCVPFRATLEISTVLNGGMMGACLLHAHGMALQGCGMWLQVLHCSGEEMYSAWSPDGRWLWTGDSGRNAEIWDVAEEQPAYSWPY